jgi:hypothetical protein
MKRITSVLGYSGAILTVLLAAVTPFVLLGGFQSAIGSLGLKIHPTFSGGELSHTLVRSGYKIVVYKRVGRTTPLQRVEPFIQAQWTPVSALPPSVSDEVDLDGDGRADVRVAFAPAKLAVDVMPLDPRYHTMHSTGVTSFSQLIAQVNDAVVVRLPVD